MFAGGMYLRQPELVEVHNGLVVQTVTGPLCEARNIAWKLEHAWGGFI